MDIEKNYKEWRNIPYSYSLKLMHKFNVLLKFCILRVKWQKCFCNFFLLENNQLGIIKKKSNELEKVLSNTKLEVKLS